MRALIVIPTFNERENLPPVVGLLLQHQDYRVLIVDDDSPDGTGAVADRLAAAHPGRVTCLHRSGQRGLGLAYVAGFTEALRSDCNVVCQMDADLSHDPRELETLINAAEHQDLVIGSRYIAALPTPHWPRRRRLLSRFANSYARWAVGLIQRDCTSGFRCWRREALARIDLQAITSRGYAFQVEMLIEAVRAGMRILEVPTSFRDRTRGVSKLSASVITASALMPWRPNLRRAAPSTGD